MGIGSTLLLRKLILTWALVTVGVIHCRGLCMCVCVRAPSVRCNSTPGLYPLDAVAFALQL